MSIFSKQVADIIFEDIKELLGYIRGDNRDVVK
jgi:hypothetical protein